MQLLWLVLFLNLFMFQTVGSLGVGLILMGWWVWTVATYRKPGRSLGLSGIVTVIIVILMQLVNAKEKLAALTLLFGATWIVTTYDYVKGSAPGGLLELVLTPTWMAWEYLRGVRRVIGSFWSGEWVKNQTVVIKKKVTAGPSWIKSVLTGVVIGLPVVAWLISLLSHADPIFANFVKNIVSEEFLRQLPSRLVWSVFIVIMMLPLLKLAWRGYRSPLGFLTRGWEREMSIVLAMVVVVLGSFLVVQWPYVFVSVAKETDLSMYGVATYSEYVKKGFGDLLQVALLVWGVAWAALLVGKNRVGQALLGLEFGVFVVSIFRRVWLYQSLHGMTLARLYGLVVLVWLVGMMVSMIMRYLYQNVRWVRIEMAWMVAVIFGSILINMESFVVKDPPTVNGRVDYVYLSRLSGDGYAGWKQAQNWAAEKLDKLSKAEGPYAHIYFYDKDDRRDIFYAGLIARELTKSYHELIMQYGSDEEVREYFREVISARLKIATGQLMDGMISDELAKVRQMRSDLDNDEWLKNVNISPVSRIGPSWDYGFPNYKAHQKDQYFYIQKSLEDERLFGLDYVLSYNPLDKQLYELIKRDIGYENLLEMQKLDFSLQKSIAAQPDSERDFDIDISLDSPFLR